MDLSIDFYMERDTVASGYSDVYLIEVSSNSRSNSSERITEIVGSTGV